MIDMVVCPNCNNKFPHDETFSWGIDENGHPTIEQLYCPHCGIGTTPVFSCSMCPLERSCSLEEECPPCGAVVNYKDFKPCKDSTEHLTKEG